MSATTENVNSFEITPDDDACESAETGGRKNESANHPAIVNNDENKMYIETIEVPDVRPADVKIADLYETMPGNRVSLLAVINLCEKPTSETKVREYIDGVQKYSSSVFSGWNLCKLLERAEGIKHVRENGDPYDEESLQPEIIEEDGQKFIQATQPPASYWVSTPEALAFAATQEPSVLFEALIDSDGAYSNVYKYVLEKVANAGAAGVTTKEMADEIDHHSFLQEPRYYASHFVKKLENAGVIAWEGKWVCAPYTSEALEKLANTDALVPEPKPAKEESSAEKGAN
jgi:hypothetical protein